MGKSFHYRTRLVLEFLRLSAISGLIFISFLVVALLIVGWAYQYRVKAMFLEALNNQLKTEIYLEDIRLELIRSFPMASLTLNGVTIMESGNHQPKDTLLRASRLQLQFSIIDMLHKDYTIKQLTASKGFVRIGYNEDGLSNFNFWEQQTPSQNVPLAIDLQKVVLNHMDVQFFQRKQRTNIDLHVSRATLSGLFQQSTFRMGADAEFFTKEVTIDSTQVLAMKPVKLRLDMVIEEFSRYVFNKGEATINGHPVSMQGTFVNTDEGVWMDASINSRKLSIHELLEDLPESLTTYMQGYSLKGELAFDALIKGYLTKTSVPQVQLSFSMLRSELLQHATGLLLKDLRMEGTFDNGSSHSPQSTTIHINSFQARLNNGSIRGGFSISDLLQPRLDLKVYADLQAHDMVNLLKVDTITAASGRVLLDVAFNGAMSAKNKFYGEDLVKAQASGTITARRLGFSFKGQSLTYHGIDGTLTFRNNDLMVESFTGQAGRSDFTISGYFRNVLPYLFLPDESLQVDAHLHARRIDFDELLQDNTSGTDTTYRLQFSERLGFHVTFSADHANFRRFAASKLSGTVSLQNKRLMAQNLSFSSMDGLVTANGFIDVSRPEMLRTGCEAKLQRVDAHQLFYQMGNFGQTSILDENIFGIISSDIRFTANWTPALEIDYNSLETDALIRIEDGVLVDYEPMNALGRFLRVDDLSRVTFSTLENMIRIKNRKIIIPQMEINSNVLNLKLSGEHTFENQVEYHLQVLLSDVLARKNRERRNAQEQFGEIIDDGLGRTTLFLKVTGHIDEPVFSYDMQGVRQKISDDLRQERESLREALRREFSFMGRQPTATSDTVEEADIPTRTLRQRDMQRIRKQEEGKIIIEWDDL